MARALSAIDSVLSVLRGSFLAVALILAAICLGDWLVRTRRVPAFSPVARFFRTAVDPILAPVERWVVNAGGLPANAPLWLLAAVVFAGIVLISVLEFGRGQLGSAAVALSHGPRGVYRLLVSWSAALLQVALIVRVLHSWIAFRPGAWYARWSFRLTEWMLRPLRRVIPTIATVDVTPIAAWILLLVARAFLLDLW
jgi:YggT family protein